MKLGKYIKQKITIDGHEFWYLPNDPDRPGGPIAPLSHCDEDGELNVETMFSSETYAHVYDDGVINRYGTPIGMIDELLIHKRI